MENKETYWTAPVEIMSITDIVNQYALPGIDGQSFSIVLSKKDFDYRDTLLGYKGFYSNVGSMKRIPRKLKKRMKKYYSKERKVTFVDLKNNLKIVD